MQPQVGERQHVSVLADVVNGALRGDFARQLGPAGVITQMVLGFVPVAGTLAAVRDLFASWRAGDMLGVLLNAMAVFPIFGGFAKTAEVLHHLRRLHASLHTYSPGEPAHAAAQLAAPAPTGRGPNPYSLLSLLFGVVAPLLSPALAIGGLTWLAPQLGWTSHEQRLGIVIAGVLLPPVLGILTGHLATGRAKRLHGKHAPRTLARIGLALGYLYLIAFALVLALVLAVAPPL